MKRIVDEFVNKYLEVESINEELKAEVLESSDQAKIKLGEEEQEVLVDKSETIPENENKKSK